MDESADWRLSRAELADEGETDVARIDRLVAAGVLHPAPDGTFEVGDVQRVLVANAVEDAGLPLDAMRRGIELGIVSFAQTDEIYPPPGMRSPRTVTESARAWGVEPDLLLRVITALGLPRPMPESHLRQPVEDQVRDFVIAWQSLATEEQLLRAARTIGQSMRQAVESWLSIYEEAVLLPLADRALPWSEMAEVAVEPGMKVLDAARSLVPWLLDQHFTQALNRLNLESIERELGLVGIAPVPRQPSAIVFADLAGYTRLTEERGDAVAAATATRLSELAAELAQRHHGRLVKLLGDGVMLHFASPADAVAAAVALRDAMAPAGLPAAHVGIHSGPVIRRESDYFGRTVNVAARLAAQAGPDEILVTGDVAAAVPGTPFEELPPLELKGIPEPVAALRVAGG